MSNGTKIEWTDETWNPLRGCTKVSAGCANCYAEKVAARFAQPPIRRADGKPDSLDRDAGPYHGVVENGHWNGEIKLVEEKLVEPLRWTKPRLVFVNSMSDLFHEAVPNEFIASVFDVMARARKHTFQVLTKRPERMRDFLRRVACCPGGWLTHNGRNPVSYGGDGFVVHAHREFLGHKNQWPQYGPVEWPLSNVWLGVSVENQEAADERIPLLLETPAAVRFVSCEPLIGPVSLGAAKGLPVCKEAREVREWMEAPSTRSDGTRNPGVSMNRPGRGWRKHDGNLHPWLDWVIVGGESGPKARPMHPDWARSLRDQCQAAQVPFLFKQWGGWAPNCLCATKEAHRTTKRPEPGKPGCMFRCGKKAAGRELDGRTWDEYPEPRS